MNNNVKLFFSFVKLLVMYTEQFFKCTINCVFSVLSGVKNRAFEKTAGAISSETKEPN